TEKIRPVVVSGPSGSGKSTLLKRLFQDYPNKFGFNTTRSPRPNEKNGVHYNFVSRELFEELIKQNKFIEYTEFSNNLYGTSIDAVRAVADEGKCCILDIELQGVKSVKKTDLNAQAIQARLKAAKEELAYSAEESSHDIIIVNDNLDIAYEQFRNFIVDS
ncbi:9816_t:CDS:2, partial [Scutellospora calospora]